jgi:hypothetical protein
MIAAFGTYFCMYGYRKPLTSATYDSAALIWGLNFKTVLITAQTLGYALSKLIGIRIISEINPARRAIGIITLIAVAELMLLMFGIMPRPFNVVFLFFNGLPLGMVFGLVLGYLEGRQMSEALIGGLCASFILADGFTKSVGLALLDAGVSPAMMPFVAGLTFLLPLLLFVWMLTKVPAPSAEDVVHRAARKPMDARSRAYFLSRYGVILIAISFSYLLGTLLRSFRSDFAPEIWSGLGYKGVPSVFARSELWVMIVVILINSIAVFIKDNRKAFIYSLLISLAGFCITILAAWSVRFQVPGFYFMVVMGIGIYLPYVAIHTTVFERLVALTRQHANIGFLMYIADTVGYGGYISIMIFKDSLKAEQGFLGFFVNAAIIISSIAVAVLVLSFFYLDKYLKTEAGKVTIAK